MNKTKTYYGEYSLKHWIDLMLTKNIVLPDYQRSFVWEPKKAKDLLEAFSNDEFVPPVVIAAVSEKDGKTSNIILDGQQRLTSVLLAYLGFFPDKEKIKLKEKSRSKVKNIADENDNINDDDEDSNEDIIEWQYSTLLDDEVSSSDEIKENLSKDEAYKEFDCKLTDDFFESSFLGFSYLVQDANEIKLQQHYYSTAFRNINIKGSPLLPMESRRALYYLDSTFAKYFEPEFCEFITIKNQNTKLDFVRYVSILSQYEYYKRKNVSDAQIFPLLVKGYSKKIEKFYEDYIYFVAESSRKKSGKDEDEIHFEKFSDLFLGGMNECEEVLSKLKRNIAKMELPKSYDSIIDLDVYYFGLIYTVVFKKEDIKTSKISKLNTQLKAAIKEFKGNELHSNKPSGFKYLRERIRVSLEIYESESK